MTQRAVRSDGRVWADAVRTSFNEPFNLRASPIAFAPSLPILFSLTLSDVREPFIFRPSPIAAAPSGPILLSWRTSCA